MSERIDLEIQAKIEKFRAEMGKIPGITAQAADKSAAALQKGLYVQAAKDAAGLGKATASAADVAGKSWADLGKKVSSLAGGPIAQLGDAVFELVPKAGQASAALGGVAAVGAGLAGAVVAAGAMAMAWKGIADAATAAEERAVKAGDASRIPTDARRGVEAYRAASEALTRTVDVLVATMGGELAGGLADVAAGAKMAVDTFLEWRKASKNTTTTLGKVRDVTDDMGRALRAVLTLGLSEWFRGAAEEAEKLTDKTKGLTENQLDDIQKAAEDEDNIRRDAAKRAAKLLEEQKKAREAAYKKRKADDLELLKALEADKAYYDERELAMQRGLHASVTAMEEEAAAKSRAITEATIASQVESFKAGTDAIIVEIDKQLAAYEKAAADKKQAEEDAAQFAVDSIGAVSDVYSAFGELIVENAESNAKASKKAQQELAIYTKKIAVTSAILSGIDAVAKAIASAPPPLNIPAIATASLTSGIQIAKAASTKIPSLFGGGTDRGDGEGAVLLHKGEGVLNQRAMDQLVRVLNQGLSPLRGLAGAGAGGGPADVYLDSRQVGRAMTRATRSGRGVSAGPPPGYVRRRG